MSTRLILTALCSFTLAARSWAQVDALPQSAEPAATIEGAAPVASSVSRDRDTLSVDFPDEDIKTILRNVADLFELNLVVPDTLTGKTSIKLRDVTWRQIFQVVLSPVGYSYIEEGNIIKVVSNESLLQEPTTTDVIIVNNAKAADLVATINVLVDAAAGGKIVVDARSNALVITERPSRMGRIRQTIEALDKATEQVMIEAKFVEVTDRDIRNIGVNWASLQGMTLGVRDINQTWERSRGQDFNHDVSDSNDASTGNSTTQTSEAQNNLTYTTSPTNINPANGGFATTTINPATGQVTGLPTSVPATSSVSNFQPAQGTTAATFDAMNSINNGTTATTEISNSVSTAVSNLFGLANTGGTSRVASAVFSSSDFQVILSALKTLNNTKIVSNPTVVTLNNTEAFINIGQEFPIPNYTYNAERGAFEVSGFAYKPIGIIMKVTPQVNSQGLIKLTVEPEVSQQNGSTSFGGAGGASIPIIATRKAKTQVSLQNGFTMGIGGLITSSKDHGSSKVPVLGDIPGLGRLFKSKSVRDEATNLIIFLTARTVSAEGATPEEVFDPSAINAVGGLTSENLPGQRAVRQ